MLHVLLHVHIYTILTILLSFFQTSGFGIVESCDTIQCNQTPLMTCGSLKIRLAVTTPTGTYDGYLLGGEKLHLFHDFFWVADVSFACIYSKMSNLGRTINHSDVEVTYVPEFCALIFATFANDVEPLATQYTSRKFSETVAFS